MLALAAGVFWPIQFEVAMQTQRPVKTSIPRDPWSKAGLVSCVRKGLVGAGWLALPWLSGCVIPVPLPLPPPGNPSLETIPSDCKEVHARSAVLHKVLRDSLRECAADIRATNPACARIDKLKTQNGHYAWASDQCVARGEVEGLPSAAERKAVRDEIATLSAQIDNELR